MRCRRIAYRYAALVGDLPSSVAAEFWVVPQAIAPALWRPRVDVFESDEQFCVTLEVAGVAEEDVEISLYADALVVTGRRSCAAVPQARWHESEIRYGPFRYETVLPVAIDPEGVSATMDRGLLRIALKKARGVL